MESEFQHFSKICCPCAANEENGNLSGAERVIVVALKVGEHVLNSGNDIRAKGNGQ